MPFHLPAFTRRRFLQGSLATAAGLAIGSAVAEERPVDPHSWALLSDPHIAADATRINKGVNMTEHLKQVVAQVVAWEQRPAQVLVNGDLAFNTGEAEDYTAFTSLVQPLRAAGLPLNLVLGNHDHREHFWTGLKALPENGPVVASKHVGIVKSERANWFLLDSLDVTNKTPGVIGDKQLDWLKQALEQHADKPALVAVHHNPVAAGEKGSGITDTEALFAVIAPRKQVKALIFGHTHKWEYTKRDGIHCVNLPAVAYPFSTKEPSGWVKFSVRPDGATFQLQALDPTHAAHGEKKELTWRT